MPGRGIEFMPISYLYDVYNIYAIVPLNISYQSIEVVVEIEKSTALRTDTCILPFKVNLCSVIPWPSALGWPAAQYYNRENTQICHDGK